MIFVTLNKRDAPVWTQKSTQASQVLLWQDFFARLKEMTRTERAGSATSFVE